MGPVCNTTLTDAKFTTAPIWHGLQFHRLGLMLSAIFALIATVVSLFLIFEHATHYSIPSEQKNIIRILFMVPIYAIVSFLSYAYYWHAIYFEVVRDCYEAFAIASFFSLLCHYIASDLHAQKEYFRDMKTMEWLWPLSWFKKCCGGDRGIWRRPRSGLTWFNIIWTGIFQYCFTRVFMTLVSVITEATGRYCQSSLNPAFAHVWTMVIEAGAVTIAMYCVIEFYRNLRTALASHSPFLKLLCVKLVIFLSFWQTLLISFLTSGNILKPSDRISHSDLKVGIPSMLLCIEMAIFSILHVFAFSWKEYVPEKNSMDLNKKNEYRGGPLGIKAILDAFNLWDLIKAAARGFRWLLVGRRKRMADRSYHPATGGLDLEPTGPDTTYHGSAHGAFSEPGSKPGKYQPLGSEERQELLTHAQPTPISPIKNPDTLTVNNPEPGMIDSFSRPAKEPPVYSADLGVRQHVRNQSADLRPTQQPLYPGGQTVPNQRPYPNPKPITQTPYPGDNEGNFATVPQGRYSFEEGLEQLYHPAVTKPRPLQQQYPQGGSQP